MKRFDGKFNDKIKPTEFKNDIYLPLGEKIKYLSKLPKNLKIFTFDINDVGKQEVMFWFREHQSCKDILEYFFYIEPRLSILERIKFIKDCVIEKENKKRNEEDSEKLKKLLSPDVRTLRRILLLLDRMLESGLFYRGNEFKNINIKEIIEDNETITSFSAFLLETDDEKGLFYGLLARKIMETKMKYNKLPPTINYIREVSYFLGETYPKSYIYFRHQLIKMIREGRDLGVYLLADSQRLKDIENIYRKQFFMIICLKMHRSEAEHLKEICDIPDRIIDQLPRMQIGKGLVICSGQFHYPVTFPPALHDKKSAQEDVLTKLGNLYGYYDYTSVKYVEKLQKDLSYT